jgi:uncharacterized protein YjbI with pentapeptide repeats
MPIPRWIPWGTVSILVLIVFVPFIWEEPTRQVRSLPNSAQLSPVEEADLVNQYRNTLLSNLIEAVGLTATITGAIFLYLNFKIANKNLEIANQNAQALREQLDLETQKFEANNSLTSTQLISEQFSRAIQQLDSNNIHVRLGGVYGLEQVARSSSSDRWVVLEILMAFIKEAPLNRMTGRVTQDVQAALKVIGRRHKILKGGRCDSKLICFLDYRLLGADLSNANFAESNFIKTDLSHATLDKANFEKANMGGCTVTYAHLNETDLTGADLNNANLSMSELKKTIFRGCNLRSTRLEQTDLTEADLSGADLTGADLSHADLTSIKWDQNTIWDGVILKNAKNIPEHLQLSQESIRQSIAG